MTTNELDKFVADSAAKGYDEALVLAGQMSSAIQDVAGSNPATFSELVHFASHVSSRYERVIRERVTTTLPPALPPDLKLLATAVKFIASGRTFGESAKLPLTRIRYALDIGPGRSRARALCERLGVPYDTPIDHPKDKTPDDK